MVRAITITPVLNGFVCQVGCQTVVFRTVAELGSAVEDYYSNPEETEKRYIAAKVNDMFRDRLPEPPGQCNQIAPDHDCPRPPAPCPTTGISGAEIRR